MSIKPFNLAKVLRVSALLLTLSTSVSLAKGDATKGKALFNIKCSLCHSVVEGKKKFGPSLFAVVGRKSATSPKFAYSSAMKKAGLTWDEATLDTYLTQPQKLVPGTRMGFLGFSKKADRANVIAYLKTLK